MALKNLVAHKAQFTEEAIEAIVSHYVRYDVEEFEIVFTSEATALSNKAKVLIFLVAQQGWQFVVDEGIDVEVEPSRMVELLGIRGGSLRPVLKDLKDRNFLTKKSGKYSVRSSSLDAIKVELDGRGGATPRPKKRAAKKRSADVDAEAKTDLDITPNPQQTPAKRAKNSTHVRPRPSEAFKDVVDEGFFDEGRSLAELQARLHERGIIIKQTSLPGYLLAAVRGRRLMRKKQEVNGKQVWVYTTVE